MHHEALIRRGNRLRLARVASDPPPPGGLRVALSFVGVCGTDLQILNGKRPDTAEILGHEGLGTVVEAAANGGLKVGDSVVFNPAAQLAKGWILGHNVPGLYQQYITVDAQAVADGLIMPIGTRVPGRVNVLAEPLAAVIYGHELICNRVPNLRSVAIFGGGPVGILAALYLRGLGVHVVLFHRSQTRLDTIKRLGIRDDAVSCRHSVDAAMICTTRTGAPSALHQAVKMVRRGGCIDLVTNYPENAPAPCDTNSLREVRAANVCGLPREGRYLVAADVAFTGHRGTSHSHLGKALLALGANPDSYSRVITHVLPLRESAFAIEELAESSSHLVKGTDCIKLAIDLTKSHG